MALKMDPNAGPLTLEHDHTRPRDLTNDPSLGAPLYQDFRFKGWPDGSFQHTHQPQYKKMSASYMNPPDVNRYFGKSQHFDTEYDARPKMDDGFNGQQYTSRDFVDPQPLSGPARGLGFDEHERDRKRRENDDMEADRIRVKNEERLRALQRDDERRRDLEMLKQYDPWGRPGGGAPIGSNHKKKFTEHQQAPEKRLEYKDNWPDRNGNSNQFWNLFSDRGDVTSFRLIPAKANVMADLWKTFRKDVTGYQPSMPTDPRRERSYDDKEKKPNIIDKIREEQRERQQQSSNPSSNQGGTIVEKLGTPGGGAPIRTESGNIKTSIIGDTLLRFQDKGREVIENTIRYNEKDLGTKQGYAKDLDKQIRQEELRKQEQRLTDLKSELEHLRINPFGKPGAGAPNRTASGNHLRLYNKMYHTWGSLEMKRIQARDSFQDRARLETFNPWGKGIGNPLRYSDGRLMVNRKSILGRKKRDDNKENYDRGNKPWTAPDSNRSYYNPNEEYDNLGKIGKAKKPNREVLPIYYPFGKPGGGAPIVDRNNRITTTLHGYSDDTSEARRQKAINAKVLAATLDQQVEHEHRRKQLEKDDKRRPFGELAVILADKPVGKPRRNPATGEIANHHLGLSDISRQKMNYQPFHKSDQRAYHNELDGMSDERRRRQQLGKLKDYQEGRQHYDTMDSLWGKHGGGAPKGYGLRKANLEDILHHPTRDQSTEEYIKKKDWSEVEPDKFFIKEDDELYDMRRSPVRYGPSNPLTAREDGSFSPHGNPKKFVRSTVTSNHANQYDYRDDYPKKDYKIGAPYATN